MFSIKYNFTWLFIIGNDAGFRYIGAPYAYIERNGPIQFSEMSSLPVDLTSRSEALSMMILYASLSEKNVLF